MIKFKLNLVIIFNKYLLNFGLYKSPKIPTLEYVNCFYGKLFLLIMPSCQQWKMYFRSYNSYMYD
jgi:hypothetical protein